jgi:hypothetical protein
VAAAVVVVAVVAVVPVECAVQDLILQNHPCKRYVAVVHAIVIVVL